MGHLIAGSLNALSPNQMRVLAHCPFAVLEHAIAAPARNLLMALSQGRPKVGPSLAQSPTRARLVFERLVFDLERSLLKN